MSTFNAATDVEALDYDFSAYDAGRGTIPEPSEDQLEAWGRGLAEIALAAAEDAGQAEITDARAFLRRHACAPAGRMRAEAEKTAQVYADVCSGTPSAQELMRLPVRVRAAFYGWLNGQFRRQGAGAPL